jgi:hypothetical protein
MSQLDLTPLVRDGFSLTPNLDGNRRAIRRQRGHGRGGPSERVLEARSSGGGGSRCFRGGVRFFESLFHELELFQGVRESHRHRGALRSARLRRALPHQPEDPLAATKPRGTPLPRPQSRRSRTLAKLVGPCRMRAFFGTARRQGSQESPRFFGGGGRGGTANDRPCCSVPPVNRGASGRRWWPKKIPLASLGALGALAVDHPPCSPRPLRLGDRSGGGR